jgi:hypothetical protein
MFGFGKHAPDARCGLVVDIGSASVAAALVVSEVDEAKPTVVWTHTERVLITPEFESDELAKRLLAVLTQVGMELSGPGLKALAQHERSLRVGETHVSVASPWSYTIPKRVVFTADQPTIITEAHVKELVTQAERETTEQQGKNPLFNQLGLEVTSGITDHFTANGYLVNDPVGQELKSLSLTRQLTICQKQLLDAVRELHDSLVPRSKLHIRSFMEQLSSQTAANTMAQRTYGLIDISGEAVEVGVVVGGALESVVSNSFGHYSLVRELAALTKQPLEAAFSVLREDTGSPAGGLSIEQQQEYQTVQAAFAKQLQDTITRTAAGTELPAHYLVHCDTGLRAFAESVVRAAANSLHEEPFSISIVSEKLTDIVTISETRLALSVAVFHHYSG